ncbi:MAG: cytochrome bc complex cytochrome b subunit [Planctomycetes bacterium]|nr:cytochrome bc complex cytochrome b subunit [Planctomycetota bacterium]
MSVTRNLVTFVRRWLGERLPMDDIEHFVAKQAGKPLPPHVSWFHTFGSLSLFLLGNQIVTGILLMVYYRPTPERAYESVHFISTKAAFGWFIRGLHAWGSTLMIIMLLLHVARTFLMAAYKKPRELTWVIGVLLFGAVVTFGFTGYLLPWTQVSYWGTTIGTEVAGSVPLVGPFAKRLLLGGDAVSGETLSRFYVVHVIVLPWVVVFLTAVHIVLMRTQGLATMDPVGKEVIPEGKSVIPFWPHHVLKEMVVFSVFLAIMATMVILLPQELGAKADPLVTPAAIKPEWYILPGYQFLKYFPKMLGLAVSTIPPLLVLLLPFLDRNPERRARKRPVCITVGVMAMAATVLLGIAGHFSERSVRIFGRAYQFDHFGIPHRSPEAAR